MSITPPPPGALIMCPSISRTPLLLSQGCACYVDEATKCANIAGGAQQLPGFAEDTGMVLVD